MWTLTSIMSMHADLADVRREYSSTVAATMSRKVYNAHKDATGKRVQRIAIEYNFIGEIYIPDEEQKETA